MKLISIPKDKFNDYKIDAIFVLSEYNKVFSDLTNEELLSTYRYKSLNKVLKKITRKLI